VSAIAGRLRRISVGGYRFMIEQAQELIKRMDAESRVAVLPDAFSGHRLVGSAAHVQAVQDALAQQRASIP
jgi:hypothetical protein